jgi:hypothetical protein
MVCVNIKFPSKFKEIRRKWHWVSLAFNKLSKAGWSWFYFIANQ